jgi:hypothetical protein
MVCLLDKSICVCDLVIMHGTKRHRKIVENIKIPKSQILIVLDIIKTKRDFQLVSSQKVLEFTILSYQGRLMHNKIVYHMPQTKKDIDSADYTLSHLWDT